MQVEEPGIIKRAREAIQPSCREADTVVDHQKASVARLGEKEEGGCAPEWEEWENEDKDRFLAYLLDSLEWFQKAYY